MAIINFDTSFSWSAVLSVVSGIVAVVGFGWSLKVGQKVQAAQSVATLSQLEDLKGQVGELRRLQFEIAAQSKAHDKTIKEVVKVAEDNAKNIKTTAAVVKSVVAAPNNSVSPETQETLNNKLKSVFIKH
jgi:hypothetical protein